MAAVCPDGAKMPSLFRGATMKFMTGAVLELLKK